MARSSLTSIVINSVMMGLSGVSVSALNISVYTFPTDYPESDGTLEWASTTMVLVKVFAENQSGLGYTYGSRAVATLIEDKLQSLVVGKDCLQVESITSTMIESIRNEGSCGIAYMAISAIDIALWDLKAKLLQLPLASLLGMVRNNVLVYGSGGFTSYSIVQSKRQFEKWAEDGISYMKMKVGRNPDEDLARVKSLKEAIGDERLLFVDANGAYTIKQALRMAEDFAKYNVTWFEEPVSSDNLKGLSFIRNNSPSGMNITAGEYGYNLSYFAKMLNEGAVDILQADVTRCGGITGFMKIGHLCEANQIPFSSHCAPALHVHAALCLPSFHIAEYFHDHVRIENEFFDGTAVPVNGLLSPDLGIPGLGIVLREADVEKYRVK